MDCVLSSPGEGPVPAYLSTHACIPADAAAAANIVEYDPVTMIYECRDSNLFNASISLVLNDGTSTAVTGIIGSLVYTTSGCAGGVCEFELTALSFPPREIAGVYTQGTTTTTGTYSIDDANLQMIGSLTGTWYQSRGTITFPLDSFWAKASMSGVTLNNESLPYWPLTFGTSQVVGNLSATSPLSLNLTFEVPGGTASVSVIAR
jgi:hypothetical protein